MKEYKRDFDITVELIKATLISTGKSDLKNKAKANDIQYQFWELNPRIFIQKLLYENFFYSCIH